MAASGTVVNSLIVEPLVPSCSKVSEQAFTTSGASDFDVLSWDTYYRGIVLNQVLPGVIVGGVCLIAALVFLIWLLTLCCRRRKTWRTRTRRHSPSVKPLPRRQRLGRLFMIVLVVMLTLGTIGVAIWSLVSGLRVSNGLIPAFWSVIAQGRDTVQNAVDVANNIFTSSNNLRALLTAAANVVSDLQTELSQVSTTLTNALPISDIQTALQTAANGIASAVTTGQTTVNQVVSKGIQPLNNFQNDYYGDSMDWQTRWRIVILACLFGLVMLFALLGGICSVVGRTPRTTAAATFLLWLLTAALLIVGAGIINGVSTVSRDSCLYAESFATREVLQRVRGANLTRVATGLDYYFGVINIAPENVTQEIFGFSTNSIQASLETQQAQSALALLTTTGVATLLNGTQAQAALETQNLTSAQILALPTDINALNASLGDLNTVASRSSFSPTYLSAKQLLCCRLTHAAHELWLSWMITGVLAAVLAIVLTIQVLDSFGPVSTNEHYVDAFPVKGGRNPADDSARELSKAERGPHGTFAAPGAYRV